jgi:hypothetical protein
MDPPRLRLCFLSLPFTLEDIKQLGIARFFTEGNSIFDPMYLAPDQEGGMVTWNEMTTGL